MTTLDDLMRSSVERALSSDSIATKAQQAAEKAVADAIDSAFGYSSEFRKGIAKAIADCIPTVNATELAIFSNAVREVMQQRLTSLASETAAEHVGKVLDSLCPDKPVITLAELKDAFIDHCIDKAIYDDHCGRYEIDRDDIEFTWIVEKSSSSVCRDYFYISADTEPDKSEYSCKFRLGFCPLEGDKFECFTVNSDGEAFKPTLFAGPLSGFAAMVFRLATKTAKLVK